MYVLMLNDMRSAHFENVQPVARANTREELEAFIARERVEPYTDTGERTVLHNTDLAAQIAGHHVEQQRSYSWRKCFKRGGPLEWFNDPDTTRDPAIVPVMSYDTWMQIAIDTAHQEYEKRVLSIPGVPA